MLFRTFQFNILLNRVRLSGMSVIRLVQRGHVLPSSSRINPCVDPRLTCACSWDLPGHSPTPALHGASFCSSHTGFLLVSRTLCTLSSLGHRTFAHSFLSTQDALLSLFHYLMPLIFSSSSQASLPRSFLCPPG